MNGFFPTAVPAPARSGPRPAPPAPPRPGDPAEVNLDVLRAVAALAVFANHAATHFRVEIPFFGRDGGWFGVQLFFLLSGYLISGSAGRYDARTYWRHRVLRLWPAFLVVFVVGGLLRGDVTGAKVAAHPGEFAVNLLLLGHLWPPARAEFPVLVVGWTLTAELLWYALAPLVVGRLRRRPWAWAVGGCALTTLWVRLSMAGALDGVVHRLVPGPVDRWLYLNNAFPALAGFFLVGALLRFRRETLARINPLAAVGLFAVFGLFPHVPPWWAWLDTPTCLSALGLGALFALALGAPPLPGAGPLRFVARISYSVYLTHHLVIDALRDRYALLGGAGVAAALALTLAVSTLLFYAVERPAMRLARRVFPA